MLKKIVSAAVFAASAVATVPTAAVANPYDECLLKAGCFYGSEGWVCADPRAYMLCLSPDGLSADTGLKFEPIKD